MASKRLKKQRECPNPLFLKWLEDWRDEAKQRNSKLQYTYGKAAAALRKYPLPLSCGKDAMILDNIGDMIARRLDEAFEEYNAHNQEVLESASIQEDYNNKGEMDPTGLSLNVPSPPLLGVDIDFGRKTTTKKKPVRRKSTREYIPAYRSGPFALLLTLYGQSQKPNYRGYMTRAELQKEAQPLCDASFTMPDPGSHYTAWSSMSTLTKKGLILKTNNPARYTLTDAGCVLVAKLENVTRSDSLTSTSNTSNSRLSGPSPPGCSEKNFTFSSVNPSTWENNKPEWDICVDIAKLSDPHNQEIHVERSANSTKVKEREKNNVEPKRIIEEDSVCASPEFVLRPGTFDILLCVDVNETSTGQAKSRKEGLAPELKKNGVQFDVRKLQLGDFLWVARERTFPTPGCLSVPVARELVLDHIVERKRMDDLCGSIIDGRFREQKKFRAELEEKDTEVRQKACYFRTNASMPNMMSSERAVFFRVAFTGDISQFPFPRHPESEKFFGFLMKHVMATAQIRVGFSDTRRSLNCVAKFRLLHCGLKHPIYLVEDFGSIQHMSLPESTLQQAVVNTQVVDGFFVKRTHDLKESVAYLTVMTRYLQRIYSNKTLVSCSQRRLEEANSSTSRQTDKKYLMSFPDFNDSTVKNKVMTVREVFAKQLMQISGMSPDKAVAILDRYPTPKSLFDAYSLLSSVKDKELLLSALKCGKNQRNLGPTLSRLIYILYSSPTLS